MALLKRNQKNKRKPKQNYLYNKWNFKEHHIIMADKGYCEIFEIPVIQMN